MPVNRASLSVEERVINIRRLAGDGQLTQRDRCDQSVDEFRTCYVTLTSYSVVTQLVRLSNLGFM